MTPLPDAAWRKRFRARLLRWYDRTARDLPWRRTRDPYAVWLSEIMLQQTTVATVQRRFESFLVRFPSIAALAEANEQTVLRAWEGLGYYRRARQLHQAARVIVRDHHGRFPRDPVAVEALPGVGRYTAGAICSIAFDLPTPILEANTQRVHARLVAYPGDPTSAEGQRLLWSMAEAVLSRHRPGVLNQALMELGSQVCVGGPPHCEHCPVAVLCRAKERGLQESIPLPKKRPALTDLHEVAVIVRRRGRVLMVKCAEGGRWAGLWDFPRFPAPETDGRPPTDMIGQRVLEHTGTRVELGEPLTTLRHGVTRYRIRLDAYAARAIDVGPTPAGAVHKWVLLRDLDRYPLSTTARKLARFAASLIA